MAVTLKDISREIDAEFYTSEFEVKNMEETEKNVEEFISENGKENNYDEFMKLIVEEKKEEPAKKTRGRKKTQ